jgi:hypothetical protein
MQVYSHQIEAPYVPVQIDFALPIVDIPGCVEAHVDSDLSSALTGNDPDGVRIFCDAHMPSFNAMDFTPELLTLSREPVIPKLAPSTRETEQQTPNTGVQPARGQQVSAGPPVAPPSDKEPEETERVVRCLDGEEYVDGRCELIPGEPISVQALVETYVPPVPAITSTAVIAVVATTSALIAKPVSDILLKLIKPAVKKIITKIKKMLGKKIKVESLRERRHQQRMRNRAIRAVRDLLKKS